MKRVICLILFLAGPSWADDPGRERSRRQHIEELRHMNNTLRRAQSNLDTSLAVDASEAVRVLSEAQVEFFAEDYGRAAIRLMQLISKPTFKNQPAVVEALTYLAESLWALGLERSARTYFKQAIEHPRQLPSGFKKRLARYYELAGRDMPLRELRRLWRRYQNDWDEEVEPTPLDNKIRYQYAKALTAHDALAEADDLFAAFRPGDLHHVKALYFRAVIHLKDENLIKAEAAFTATLEAWQASQPEGKERPYLEDVDAKGDARQLVELKLSEAETLPPPEVARQNRLGAVIHLALARLNAARGKHVEAWNHYRKVPRGDPDFAAALAEATFVLFQREQYAWCVRLVDQLLAGRGDDVSAAQLRLWKAQLLARSTQYDAARQSYEILNASLTQRGAQLTAQLEEDKRIFPQAVLAWTAPDNAIRARRLEADLVTQDESLIEAKEMARTLANLLDSEEILPAVARGRRAMERLNGRMAQFEEHLEVSHAESEDVEDFADIDASAATLKARIIQFGGQLDAFEGTFRKRIAAVLKQELPALKTLTLKLESEMVAARSLGKEMRVAAQDNIETYAAEAMFGQVDITYWRKQEITRKLSATMELQGVELASMETAMNPPKPPKRKPSLLPADGYDEPDVPDVPDDEGYAEEEPGDEVPDDEPDDEDE
ncbi:MAG: hypothetical protein ACI9U2_001386 [Bradymonadia bacterium]